LLVLLLVPLVAEYRASPSPIYPQLGYNPQHTGLSPWSGPQTSNLYLSVLVSQTHYGIWGKAVDANGVIYVGSEDGNFYAINPDGTIKWTLTGILVKNSFPATPAIGPDGTIYVGSDSSKYLYAINPDGTIKWKYGPINLTCDGIYYFPAVTIGPDGTLYVSATDDYVYAIKPDGTLKWRYGQVIYSYYGYTIVAVMQNPAIGPDGTVYIVADCGWLYALNPDGTLKWRFSAVGAPSYAKFSDGLGPVVGKDGTIYMADDTYVYAINPDGTVKWEWSDPNGTPMSNLVITDKGLLLVGDYFGYLYALGVPNLPSPKPKISVALAPNYSLWALLLVAMCVAGFAFASRGKIALGISFITGAIAVYYVVLRPFVSLQTLITQAQQLLSNALAQIPLGPILPLIVAVAGIAVLAKVLRR